MQSVLGNKTRKKEKRGIGTEFVLALPEFP
jgi:hypothetical protein